MYQRFQPSLAGSSVSQERKTGTASATVSGGQSSGTAAPRREPPGQPSGAPPSPGRDGGGGSRPPHPSHPSARRRSFARSTYPASESMQTKSRPARSAATPVVPAPAKGSRTTSPLKVYSWMQRYGSSTGKGAGWPTLRADSVGKVQRLFVHSRNSSRVIVSSFSPFFRA